MSEWIPVAEKLIDLGHYYVTMMVVQTIIVNGCIATFLISAAYMAYRLMKNDMR